MPRIVGGGGSTPPVSVNSTESIQQNEETKPSNTVETQSNIQSQNKTAADTRAVTEHKLMGNLQQMRLNSMFDVVPLKGGSESKAEYNFYEAWPAKWYVPELDSDKKAVRTEQLDIAH